MARGISVDNGRNVVGGSMIELAVIVGGSACELVLCLVVVMM